LERQTNSSLVLRDLCGPDTLSEFHFVWLRDNCPCGDCLHPSNQQKLHNSFQVPVGIRPTEARVEGDRLLLKWDTPLEALHLSEDEYRSNGGLCASATSATSGHVHETAYSLSRLVEGAYSTVKLAPSGPVAVPPANAHVSFVPTIWDEKTLLKSPDLFMDFNDVVPASLTAEPSWDEIDEKRDIGLYRFLKQLDEYGLVVIRNMPFDSLPGSFGQPVLGIERVAERIGPILETFYGRTWDVKKVERSNNIAYTSVELGLHTDLWLVSERPLFSGRFLWLA
jgi:hypothetical protein